MIFSQTADLTIDDEGKDCPELREHERDSGFVAHPKQLRCRSI